SPPGTASPRHVTLRDTGPMGGERVLVVELDESVRAPIRAILGGEGYVLTEVASASEALAQVAGCDLALVSLALRDVAGRELVAALRGRRPDLPIVVTVTADAREEGFAVRAA